MYWRWRDIDRKFLLTLISYRCFPIASVANIAIFPLDLDVFKFQMGINCNITASENFSCFLIIIILNL